MISPRYYRLHLEPLLQEEIFHGSAEIHLDIHGPTNQVILDAEDLDIRTCRAEDADDKEVSLQFAVKQNPGALEINLDHPVRRFLKIYIDYIGPLRNDLRSFYLGSYKKNDGSTGKIAATQFEENDARRAFPCIDSPSKKAFFDIEILVGGELTAVSNTPVIQIEEQDDHKQLFRFHRTPKMPTYLVFFGVGEFERYPSLGEERERTISRTNIPVRVLATPGKAKQGDFARRYAIRALEYLDGYTGVPYPIGKMDLIALPQFAWGAMENYGAVTYRENRILVTPGVTPVAVKASIARITAHEIAHMWFGNLVSPKSWKYVWLNESFASLYDDRIIHDMHPEWMLPELNIAEALEPALDRDALPESPPLELPSDEITINVSNTSIVYAKGSRILLMLEDYLGEDGFRLIVSTFLKRYQFSSVGTDEFLSAISDDSSGTESGILDGWVYQPGFPLIRADRSGDTVKVTQERFLYGGKDESQTWRVPITADAYDAAGGRERIRYLLEGREGKIDLPAGSTGFILNPDRNGYYRADYTPGCHEGIEAVLAFEGTPPAVKAGMISDLYALSKKGEKDFAETAEFVKRWTAGGRDIVVLQLLCGILRDAYQLLPAKRGVVKEIGEMSLLPYLMKIGIEPQPGEELTVSTIRGHLIGALSLLQTPEVGERLSGLFEKLVDGKLVDSDLRQAAMRAGARRDPDTAFRYIKRQLEEVEDEQVKYETATVLGGFTDPGMMVKALELAANSVAQQNRHLMFDTIGATPEIYTAFRTWIAGNLDYFKDFHSYMYERSLYGTLPFAFAGAGEGELSFIPELTAGNRSESKESVAMILELLRVNRGFTSREG